MVFDSSGNMIGVQHSNTSFTNNDANVIDITSMTLPLKNANQVYRLVDGNIVVRDSNFIIGENKVLILIDFISLNDTAAT